MRWTVAVMLVVLVAASGCAAKEPPKAAPPEEIVDEASFEDYHLDAVAPSLGAIRGVVVDAALRPLAGVNVSIVGRSTNQTTSDGGLFVFKDLEPGTYFLAAKKDRYQEVQTSTIVQANVAEPEVVRILMSRLAGTEPRVVVGQFKGFMQCSLRIPAAGFNDGCLVFGDLGLGSTQRVELSYEGTTILWWQGELVWESSGPTTERLCLGVSGETLAGDDLCGPNPVVQAMDRERVVNNDLETNESFEMVAYPDHLLADVSGNLVLQQAFTFYHVAFYNFVPPEGYTFAKDGEPVVPP